MLDNELVAPAMALEATLAEIWKDVLGCKDLGVTDDFFELGGDSLHATIMLQLIETRCGVELGYSVLFKAPRIRDLAVLIEQARLESQVGRVGVLGEEVGVEKRKASPWAVQQDTAGLGIVCDQVLQICGCGCID